MLRKWPPTSPEFIETDAKVIYVKIDINRIFEPVQVILVLELRERSVVKLAPQSRRLRSALLNKTCKVTYQNRSMKTLFEENCFRNLLSLLVGSKPVTGGFLLTFPKACNGNFEVLSSTDSLCLDRIISVLYTT